MQPGMARKQDRRQGDRGQGQEERRREPRFEAKMWVGIPEAEGEADVEDCDISAAGMLLYTPRDAGEPGAVRMLRLVTGDLGTSIEIMAHVVRVETREDPDLGSVRVATAFEFLPHQPEELEAFLGIALEGEFSVATPDRLEGIPAREPAVEAQGDADQSLQVSHVTLDANRALEEGTRVWLELETPAGESLRFSGSCLESLPLEGAGHEDLYRVTVSIDSRDCSGVDPMPGGSRKGLSGALSEVEITSLLGFFELERSSGVLALQHESEKAFIFVREGTVVDVDNESAGEESALDSIVSLLRWPDGTFEFNFQSVDREDALGMSTTSLLMECARRNDEESQAG